MATNDTSEIQKIVETQINFFNSGIKKSTRYVDKDRRIHVANLLGNYLKDLGFKQNLLEQLSNQEKQGDKIKEELTKQLDEEKTKIVESEHKYKEELAKCEKEVNELSDKNKKMNEMLKKMIEFIKTEKHAFFGYLAEKSGDGSSEIMERLRTDSRSLRCC